MSEPGELAGFDPTRRMILKGSAAGLLATALCSMIPPGLAGDQSEISKPWSDIDFVDHPDMWLSGSLQQKAWDDLWRVGRQISELNGVHDTDEWDKNTRLFINDIVQSAVWVEIAKTEKLNHVLPEVRGKYHERATYLFAFLRYADYLNTHTPEEFIKLVGSIPVEEHISAAINQSDPHANSPLQGINRVATRANWTYDWDQLLRDQHKAPHPLKPDFDTKFRFFTFLPNKLAREYLYRIPRTSLPLDPDTGHTRPLRPEYINVTAEVQAEIDTALTEVGMERTMKSIQLEPGQADRYFATTNVQAEVIFQPDQPLTGDRYRAYADIYKRIIRHEGWHALTRRADALPDREYLKYRNITLAIADRFDPLKNMKAIFAPEGRYMHASDAATISDSILLTVQNPSSMTITDYYIAHLLNPDGDQSLRLFTDEMRRMYSFTCKEDLYKHLWIKPTDTSIEDTIGRLERSRSTMDPMTQLIADTIIANKASILEKNVRGSPEIFNSISSTKCSHSLWLTWQSTNLKYFHPTCLRQTNYP